MLQLSFMGVFLGTAATCIFMAVSSLSKWHQPGVLYLLLGTLLYLVGIVGVTILCNLPLNEALAKSDGCGDRDSSKRESKNSQASASNPLAERTHR